MQAGGQSAKDKKVVPQGSHPDADRIDKDGLPVVGTVLYPNQSFYNTQDDDTGAAHAWSRSASSMGNGPIVGPDAVFSCLLLTKRQGRWWHRQGH